ncbi:hypothetical protein OY671_011266 [Metschnikowia pulcherrima]|nr:hypothetical protein OY671_011266 [Metschnikowia pulcherrima]
MASAICLGEGLANAAWATIMDAVTAAKERIERALADSERKVSESKARPASAPPIADDDSFAPRPSNAADSARIAESETAGQETAQASARAADAVREVSAQQQAQTEQEAN